MEIFIDTSVIYTDPFWKRNFPSELLEAAKDERVTIYISDVVLRELRRNFEKQLDKEISAISTANNNIRKISRSHKNIDAPVKDQYLNDFDNYYDKLFKNNSIIKLPTDEKIFNELLERAIERKKPFTDNRSEFKDAVIWTTYYKYAKAKQLSNCHLLTNNKKDFTDNEGKLHQELRSDYDEFTVHVTIDEFYKANKDIIDKPIIEFKNWLGGQNIDDKYVFELLFENEANKVFNEIRAKYEHTDPSSLVDDRDFADVFGGYVDIEDIEWYSCSNIEIDIIKNYAIISGTLNLNVTFEIYGYNSVRDAGDDKFPYFGSIEREVELYFNFIFDEEEIPKSLEVTDIV